MAAHSTSLPLRCPKCTGTVTLFVSPWTADTPRQPQTWKCPHCHAENAGDLPGKVLWVLARQET